MASSRRPARLPANLQGIWNEQMWAPWEADYHLNINLQMNYWPAGIANLPETIAPLMDWFELLAYRGRESARRLKSRRLRSQPSVEGIMALKERLQRHLAKVRGLSERFLADFHTPEQWVFQVHPSCNHALWFAGHIAQSDNYFFPLVAPERAVQLPEFPAKFGMGSQPTNNPGDYPPPETVLACMSGASRPLRRTPAQ